MLTRDTLPYLRLKFVKSFTRVSAPLPSTGQYPRFRIKIPRDKLDLLVGATLENRYYVLSVLGKGGMSLVYKAKDLQTGEIVAVKTLRTQALADEMIVKRFQREAEVLNRLNHPRIVQIFSYGTSKRGQPYFVMDYLVGTSLGEILRTQGAMDLERFQNIFVQVSAAIGHAHKHGAIHRDVKPGNIMLVTKGGATDYVKIVDFGIAKLAEEAQKLTRIGEVWGSPIYMSPEQCMGSTAIDERTDIYSLGIVMYEALTGEVPFLGRSYVDTMARQISEPAAPFSEIAPQLQIPASLEMIVFKAIQKSPEERYQTMGEMKHDLERALSPQPASQEGSQSRSLFGLFKSKIRSTSEYETAHTSSEPPPAPLQEMVQEPVGPTADSKPFQLTGPNVIAASETGSPPGAHQDFTPPGAGSQLNSLSSGLQKIQHSGTQNVLDSGRQQILRSGPQNMQNSGEQKPQPDGQNRSSPPIDATIAPRSASRGYIKNDTVEATIAPEKARTGSARSRQEQPEGRKQSGGDQEGSASGQRPPGVAGPRQSGNRLGAAGPRQSGNRMGAAGPRQSGNRMGAQNKEGTFDASPGAGDMLERTNPGDPRQSSSRNPRSSSPRISRNKITSSSETRGRSSEHDTEYGDKRGKRQGSQSKKTTRVSRKSNMTSLVLKLALAFVALLAGFGLASSPTVRDWMCRLVFEKETEAPEHPTYTEQTPQP